MMFDDRKVNVCEGVPLNSTSSGAANIFLNAGKNTKAKSDGTVIHLDTAKPADIGVHINTTLSIASSKKIKLLFILNFLLSVICMAVSGSIGFYYWNEMVSMRRQLETIKDQILIKNLEDVHQEKTQQSALVSNMRPPFRGSEDRAPRMDERAPRMDAELDSPSSPKKYYVEDLGDDMLLVDSSKKTEKAEVPTLALPIFQKDPLVVHFNGDLEEIHMGEKGIVGPWERDLTVSTKGSESRIELHSDYVVVQESGVYLIYAQLVYISRGPNCYFLFAKTGKKPRLLSTCGMGTDTSNRELSKLQMSCSIQTVARLNKGDILNIAQREPNRTLWLRPGNSYLGFIKLSS